MAASDLINLSGLIDDAKCFAFVRQHRWPGGVCCPVCDSSAVIRDGCDDTQPCRQRYRCKACSGRFDDLTGTVLAAQGSPHFQIAPNISRKTGCAASIWANCSTRGRRRCPGMVGMSS